MDCEIQDLRLVGQPGEPHSPRVTCLRYSRIEALWFVPFYRPGCILNKSFKNQACRICTEQPLPKSISFPTNPVARRGKAAHLMMKYMVACTSMHHVALRGDSTIIAAWSIRRLFRARATIDGQHCIQLRGMVKQQWSGDYSKPARVR